MSTRDDTPTWRKNKPRVQTSDDRALQHRPAKSSPGIPMPELEEPENTKPWDLLDREQLNADELEVVKRSRRESNDPVTYADIVKLTARVLRKELSDHSEQKRQLDEAAELLDRPPRAVASKLQGEVAALKFRVKIIWLVGGTVLTIALGSLGLAISALHSQAVHEGELNADIARLKSDVQQLIRGEFSSRHQPKDTQ